MDLSSFVEPKLIPSAFFALAGTSLMSLFELPLWQKWGITAVLEWHENLVLSSKIVGRDLKAVWTGILSLHYLNGVLAGLFFPVFAWLLISLFGLSNTFIIGITYAALLWILTLAPIHKPITGLSPFNHPLGKLPLAASISGHLIYGLVISLVLIPK